MELKQNAVLIFKNNRKNGESHPDYKGEIDVNGQRYEIALWVKEGAKVKFFSGKISEPWKKDQAEPAKEQPQTDQPTDTDSLPF